MNCAHITIILSQHADVTLAEATAIEAHLASCPRCRSMVLDLETQTEHYFAMLAPSEARPPTALLMAMRSTITDQPQSWKSTRFWRQVRPFQVGLAVLGLLLIWISVRLVMPQVEHNQLAQLGTTSATASAGIAQGQPSLTPISTIIGGETTKLPTASTILPTNGTLPSVTQTTAPPMLANPLATSTISNFPPREQPTALPPTAPIETTPPLATIVPLPTDIPIISPEIPEAPTEVLPTIAPELPTEAPESTAIPTRMPPNSPQPIPPTTNTTPVFPTAIGTPVPTTNTTPVFPTAIGTPVPTTNTTPVFPTAIGTPVPTTNTTPVFPTAIGTPVPTTNTTPVFPTAIGTPVPTETPSATSVAPATPTPEIKNTKQQKECLCQSH